MAYPTSIKSLTNNAYSELKFNSSGKLIAGDFMNTVCIVLNKCNVYSATTTVYDISIESAVSNFQKKYSIPATGILNDETWQKMISYVQSNYDDTISEPEDDILSSSDGDYSDSPHYNSFFDTSNSKTPRKNRQDIKIVFGSKISKTIKDVFMRSVSVEIDTSGNPISEVYEFIARDVLESDEGKDKDKYTSIDDYSSSDIQYIYNFGSTTK